MKLRLVSVCMFAFIVSAAAQQAPPSAPVGTGLIVGRTVDATSGRPVARATVYIAPEQGAGPATPIRGARVITDEQGRFVLRALPKGTFTLTATRPGYVPGAYGKQSPYAAGNGQPLELADGERRGDITLALWKYGVISGTVTDEAGEPMLGVQVRVLRRGIVAGRWQLTQSGNQPATDDRGIYRATSLPPGQYVLGVVSTLASMPVELHTAYAQAVASGSSAAFSRGVDPSVSMSSGAGIRRGSLVLFPGTNGPGSGTGDSSPVRGGETSPLLIYPTVFYLGAQTVTQADAITVNAGEERSGIDFRLRLSPAVTVSGTVVGPDGPSSNTSVQLLPSGVELLNREYSFEAATAVTDRAGAFTFAGVTPGQYVVRVLRPPPRPPSADMGATSVVQVGSSTITSFTAPPTQPPIPDDPTFWATVPVSVGTTDVRGVEVALRNGLRIAGRVEFNGAAAKPTADRLRQIGVTIESADGRSAGAVSAAVLLNRGQIDADGALRTYQLPAGQYLIRVSGTVPGWTFAGAWHDGKDVSAEPLDVSGSDVSNVVLKFTDRPAELAGTVRDESRAVVTSGTVLLFPANERTWTDYGTSARRFRSAVLADTGTYKFPAVAEGDYFVVAVHELPAEWQDPAFLEKVAAAATRVTILEGDRKTQDLRRSVIR